MNSFDYQMQWSDYPSESSSQVLYKTLPVAPYDNYYSYNSQITPNTGEHTVNVDSTITKSNEKQKVVISKYEIAQLIPSATWLTIKTRKRRRPCITPTAKLVYHRTAICVHYCVSDSLFYTDISSLLAYLSTLKIMHYCYLLRSINPKFLHSTYIGYTVNPKRRIRQHNREIVNGAWKTHRALPWEMIVVICGFPSQKEGLSFEWAWQHPIQSHICRSFISPTLARRRKYISKIEIALQMLSHSPWNSMNLYMTITNETIFQEVQHTFYSFSNVHIQYLPLQQIDSQQSEDDNNEEEVYNRDVNVINTEYDKNNTMYISNSYCSNFTVK